MQEEFIDFIEKHHVLNLCVCKDDTPWSASCFYAFNKDKNIFIIASDKNSKHAKIMQENPNISATITLETKKVGLIQGMQFSGIIVPATKEAKKIYFRTYPYALAMLPTLWEIEVRYAKLTNNRLGFGKKLEFKLLY